MFLLFHGKYFKGFWYNSCYKKKSHLVPLNAIRKGWPKSLANAAMKTPPVTAVDDINPAYTMLVIVLHRFIIFANF